MEHEEENNTALRYFSGLAENTFQSELGIVDPPLIDYLSELLIRFVRSDVVHRIRGVSGKPLMSVPEMISEASTRIGDAQRELHQHIGDFTLFWAGVYPEALRHGEDTESSAQFDNYRRYGKHSYHVASSIDAWAEDAPPAGLLQRLGDQFDLCCYGLREVRRQWESGDGEGPILLG